MNVINRFQIKNLHGYKNIDLKIEDNIIILVGENGSGKTTVLRLLFYFLSRKWTELIKYRFDCLNIVIDNQSFTLPYSLIEKNIDIKIMEEARVRRRLPYHMHRELTEIIDNYRSKPDRDKLDEIVKFSEMFEIPIEYALKQYSEEAMPDDARELNLLNIKMQEGFTANLLYLPTYRRIEQELKIIFKGLDEEILQRRYRRVESREKPKDYIELIEFGMKDVDVAISSAIEGLEEYALEELNELSIGYIGEIVEEKYQTIDVKKIQDASQDTIKKVLDRIHEEILSTASKQHLSDIIQDVATGKGELDENKKAICHYFNRLLDFQQNLQQKESRVTNFFEVCNRYMVDKELFYDSVKFEFSIKLKNNLQEKFKKIDLQNLSSGEKQIVSLFSQLYLSESSNFIVIIDEPELSLSVPWQRKFLVDIKNGDFCSGLMAVTHSPYIYDNELEKYAHGLGEFSD